MSNIKFYKEEHYSLDRYEKLLRKIGLSDSDKIYKNWTKERYYEL